LSGEPIDLLHGGAERTIGVYLLDTAEGLSLFDCGPSSCIPALKAGLFERGVELGEIRNLLLSHIHLDHAGAAGSLVREHPELRVWVSEVGAPHLADPSRLERSARRLYGDAFDGLWGKLAPVPKQNIQITERRAAGLEVFPAPGHASHHVCYVQDGTVYAGDAAGVRIQPSRPVLPPTPPPDVDVEAWHATAAELRRREPERLALIHFGAFDDVGRHLDELERRLDDWTERVAGGVSEPEFVEAALADVDPGSADEYATAMPFEQSYAGLRRYVAKRAAVDSS
jgi:glyoxylase-like metal-dependent hydrolase (beta-lactamase superfamily II)